MGARSITSTRRLRRVGAFTAAVAVAMTLPVAVGTDAASSKSKAKIISPGSNRKVAAKRKAPSKSKILDFSAPVKYLLTINGNFRMKDGDAIEEGTIEVPFIVVNIVTVGSTKMAVGEPATGAVREHLEVTPDCAIPSGLVVLDMSVLPLGSKPPNSADLEASDLTALVRNAPAGMVGMVAIGAFASAPAGNTISCYFPTPRVTKQVTMAGAPATAALSAAGDLIFPSGGGSIDRKRESGDFTYKLNFVLKKA